MPRPPRHCPGWRGAGPRVSGGGCGGRIHRPDQTPAVSSRGTRSWHTKAAGVSYVVPGSGGTARGQNGPLEAVGLTATRAEPGTADTAVWRRRRASGLPAADGEDVTPGCSPGPRPGHFAAPRSLTWERYTGLFARPPPPQRRCRQAATPARCPLATRWSLAREVLGEYGSTRTCPGFGAEAPGEGPAQVTLAVGPANHDRRLHRVHPAFGWTGLEETRPPQARVSHREGRREHLC